MKSVLMIALAATACVVATGCERTVVEKQTTAPATVYAPAPTTVYTTVPAATTTTAVSVN